MTSAKILIVDDEKDIREMLSYNMKSAGYNVQTASNGLKAIEKAGAFIPDLILMDIMMPEMDGIEACSVIRRKSELNHILIAFLTARGEDYSQIAGYDAGADDYITKPIKPSVLIKKVESLLRRRTSTEPSGINQVNDDLSIDSERYIVIFQGKEYELPRKEFELLAFLAAKKGNVFTRERIMAEVWRDGVMVGDRTIDVHVRKLREKFGTELIKTVKGVGYKLA